MKEKQVWVIEDDVFASAMMQSLLTRDWRTTVLQHTYDYASSAAYLKSDRLLEFDYVVIDIETYDDADWPFQLIRQIRAAHNKAVIIATCTWINTPLLEKCLGLDIDGLFVKQDIGVAIAPAVYEANRKQLFVTERVMHVLPEGTGQLAGKTLQVLKPGFDETEFSTRENQIIQLGILFNQSSKDISDELNLSYDYVRQVISKLYLNLEIKHMRKDRESLIAKLKSKELVSEIERLKASEKTISFYIITALK